MDFSARTGVDHMPLTNSRSAGQLVIAGGSYQGIARLGFARESWTAPLAIHAPQFP
jgi:hypothetical protein